MGFLRQLAGFLLLCSSCVASEGALKEILALYADQQQEKAQELFLELLEKGDPSNGGTVPKEEVAAFQSLFPLYEETAASFEAGVRLLQEVDRLLQAHPRFYSLGHYAAVVLANQGHLPEFFERSYRAAMHRPNCFLAWKVRGVLHLRLFEVASVESRRAYHKGKALWSLKEALKREANDSSLWTKIVFLSSEEEKKDFLKENLPILVGRKQPLQKNDCLYLIDQAIATEEFELAGRLIEQARRWYRYSRMLDVLEHRLYTSEKKHLCEKVVPCS